jgi:hypothetical protein
MDTAEHFQFAVQGLTMKDINEGSATGQHVQRVSCHILCKKKHYALKWEAAAARSKKLRTNTVQVPISPISASDAPTRDARFFQTVSDDCCKDQICKFIDATGSVAFSMQMVTDHLTPPCARDAFAQPQASYSPCTEEVIVAIHEISNAPFEFLQTE